MAAPVFTQTTIAMVWDFDKTLIPGYMQGPLFERYHVDEKQFWSEVNALDLEYRERGCEQVSNELAYLNHVLDYTERGIFAGLNNQILGELGTQLEFYPGLPDFFSEIKQRLGSDPQYAQHEITLEHYIVSTGFTRTIRGSAIAEEVDGVWGCEFIETNEEYPRLSRITYVLDNTTKTRAVFEINKGVNKYPGEINVNASFPEQERRIPFNNMIYIADGPSDVPVFSVVKRLGGRTYGVYNPGHEKEFRQVKSLQEQGRVDSMGAADYRNDSQTFMWLWSTVQEIADRIVSEREQALGHRTGEAPRHLND